MALLGRSTPPQHRSLFQRWHALRLAREDAKSIACLGVPSRPESVTEQITQHRMRSCQGTRQPRPLVKDESRSSVGVTGKKHYVLLLVPTLSTRSH